MFTGMIKPLKHKETPFLKIEFFFSIIIPDMRHLKCIYQGRIQHFKLGEALKKIAPSGGRREYFWGIS
jgi:hypothetical protein